MSLVKIFVLLIKDWNDASEVLSGLGFAIMLPILSDVFLTTSIENAWSDVTLPNCPVAVTVNTYVFSNEGISHGHALAFTTSVAHKFNKSQFYERFTKIVKKLNFSTINLKQNLDDAADLILQDKKHLDNNPHSVDKNHLVKLLEKINDNKVFE